MPFTRRSLIARAGLLSGAAVVASAVPPAALARPRAPTAEIEPWPPLRLPDPPLRAADYLGVADEVVRRLDRTWVEEERAYSSGGRGIDAIYNGALLTIHAIAAVTSSGEHFGTQPSSSPLNGCSTSMCSRGPSVRTRAASASSCAEEMRSDGIRVAVGGPPGWVGTWVVLIV